MIIRMKRHKKQMKMKKSLAAAVAIACFLTLPGCKDASLSGKDLEPPTISVAKPVPPAETVLSGPLLHCKVGRGSALFGRDWYDFDETDFLLHKGGHINITLSRRRSTDTMKIRAIFDAEGQKIVFCPVVDGPPGQQIRCASLYALEDDLRDGIKRTFDIPNAVRGGEISCAFQQENLKSLETPPAGGN